MSVVESWLTRIGINFIIIFIGLSYALDSFNDHGITTPAQLMNLNFEDFDERIFLVVFIIISWSS